jgi:hypothetical protein
MKEMIDSTKKVAEDIFDYIEVENQKVELTHANKTIYVSRPIRKTMEYIKKRTPIEGTGIWRRVRKMLPSSVVRNTHQAKEKNQESLKRGRVLLESEYQYWSKNKPSVLDK